MRCGPIASTSRGRCSSRSTPTRSLRVRSRQRGVTAAVTQALAGRLCASGPDVRAQRPADLKLLTPRGPAQTRDAAASWAGAEPDQSVGRPRALRATVAGCRAWRAHHNSHSTCMPNLHGRPLRIRARVRRSEHGAGTPILAAVDDGRELRLFGIGAVVVGVVLLPLVRIIPATRERRRVARARS